MYLFFGRGLVSQYRSFQWSLLFCFCHAFLILPQGWGQTGDVGRIPTEVSYKNKPSGGEDCEVEGEHNDSMGTIPARAVWVFCCNDGNDAFVFVVVVESRSPVELPPRGSGTVACCC